MVCYISFGEYNKHYKYILLGSLFAFLTNIIFGYNYDENLNLFIIIDSNIEKKLSYHIIYHYIFRFLGIFLISLIKYNSDKKRWKEEELKKTILESESSMITQITKK